MLLAPMSGVSDLPFRTLAHRHGAGLVVSEMVASEELVRQRRDVLRRAEAGSIRPFVMQLAGREARWMAEGARIAVDLGADVIDINMGCPAREVTGKLSGSALMRDLDHAESLIAATVAAVAQPVTLKMRLGWDRTTLNAPELARRAENAGVVALTRTLAKESARSGITVNAVLPGYIETDALAGMDDEARKQAARGIPMRRFGKPAEVAAAVYFLASPEAAYITGATLKIDGGIY